MALGSGRKDSAFNSGGSYGFSGDANNWRDNKSNALGQFGRNQDRSTWSLARKRREGNRRLAAQADRNRQQQRGWWQMGLDNTNRTINDMEGYRQSWFNDSKANLDQFGNRMDSVFGDIRDFNKNAFTNARAAYGYDEDGNIVNQNSMAGMGQLGGNYLLENAFNPRAYERHLVGEFDPQAMERRGQEAYETSRRASNARGGGGIMDLEAARNAQADRLQGDQMYAQQMANADRDIAMDLRGMGNNAARAYANLWTGQSAQNQNLGVQELNMRGQNVANLNNLLSSNRAIRDSMATGRDTAFQNFALRNAGILDRDFQGWSGRADRDMQWATNALYQDRVRDEQTEQANKFDWGGLAKTGAGLFGTLATGGTGTGANMLFSKLFG